MKNIIAQFDTASRNLSDLTPSFVNRDANVKLLNKLEERNREKLNKNPYNYKSIVDGLKSRNISNILTNPEAYAVKSDGNSNPENQKIELIRMAKITATRARQINPFVITDYEKAKERFINAYSKKIIEFRMMPNIQNIFEQFKDPNYSEKGYDQNYLGQGVSDQYLNSLTAAAQSKELKKSLANLEATSQTEMSKIATQLQKNNDLQLVLQSDTQQLKDITDEIRQKELEDEAIKKAKKDIKDAQEGKRDEGAPPPLTPAEIELQAVELVLNQEEETIKTMPEAEFDKVFGKFPSKKGGKLSFESQVKQVYATLTTNTYKAMKNTLITKYTDEFPILPVVGTASEQKNIANKNKQSAVNIALREGRERYLSKL
jgi:hypothetical protein